MKYIFWDIDGTLLKTGLAGVDALRDAIKCRFGIENFQFSHPLAGMTDSFIFKQTIKDIKGSCNAADAAGFDPLSSAAGKIFALASRQPDA